MAAFAAMTFKWAQGRGLEKTLGGSQPRSAPALLIAPMSRSFQRLLTNANSVLRCSHSKAPPLVQSSRISWSVFPVSRKMYFSSIIQEITSTLAPVLIIIQVFSYVFGWALALLSYLYSRRDRRDLVNQAIKLGAAQQEAQDARRRADEQAEAVRSERAEVDRLNSELKGITEGSQELWKLRPPHEFPEFRSWLRDPVGAKLLTVGNLKGGVGKTTISANLAAYVSETLGKRVLLIDLDYQASLSNMMLLAINSEDVESKVEKLFDAGAELATVMSSAIHLVPKLSRGWLVPANYPFAQTENLLLLQWLIDKNSDVDVRYRLAHTLLNPNIRQRFDLIIFDMPPRMTLGSVNALVASHHFVVPTALDKLSAEAVATFVSNMKAIKTDLNLDLELAWIVGGLSRAANLNQREEAALELAREGGKVWRTDVDFVLPYTIPRAVDIANAAGEDIAYLTSGPRGAHVQAIFDPIFAAICKKIGLIN